MAHSYRVVTLGVATDNNIAEVARTLAARSDLSAEKWRAVLEAPRFVLKRGLDLLAAVKLDRALSRAGCLSTVEADRPESRNGLLLRVSSVRMLLRAQLKRWRRTQRKVLYAALVVACALGSSAALVIARRSESPTRPMPTQRARLTPAAPLSAQAMLVGAWSCRSYGPNGFFIQRSYLFRADGSYEDAENGISFAGRYYRNGNVLVLAVQRARDGATTFAPNMTIDASYDLLADGRMKLTTQVSGTDRKLANICTRIAHAPR